MALGHTQPPIQQVPGALSLGVKQLGHEAVPPLPKTPSWHGAQLKHRDNFTFTTLQIETIWKNDIQMGG